MQYWFSTFAYFLNLLGRGLPKCFQSNTLYCKNSIQRDPTKLLMPYGLHHPIINTEREKNMDGWTDRQEHYYSYCQIYQSPFQIKIRQLTMQLNWVCIRLCCQFVFQLTHFTFWFNFFLKKSSNPKWIYPNKQNLLTFAWFFPM